MKKLSIFGVAISLLTQSVTGCYVCSVPVMAEEVAVGEETGFKEIDLSRVTTTDEVIDFVEQDVEATVGSLTSEYETIKQTLADFSAYQNNPSLTEEYYAKINTEIKALSIRLREYALKYATIVIDSDTSFDDKYDDLEDIYNDIYEDAAEEIYDEIYDSLLDDMYDDIYDGIIDDGYDTVAYDVWDDARSFEYGLWDDTRSQVYTLYDDVRSDIYNFYDKIRSHVYKENSEKINKDIAKFQKKVDKLKGIEVEEPIMIDLSTLDLSVIMTVEEMDAIVEADVETLVSSLYSELEGLQAEIDSYEKYRDNSSKTEEFYDHVVEEVELVSGRLREYTLRYAEIITASGMSFEDQYDELSAITDAVYSDAGTTLNREIYGGVLKNALKIFYKDILKTGYDLAPYSEVSDFRSDEYSNLSDARSDVYGEISDMRSDIYSFTSDIRSAVWGKDSEKVTKKLEKFRKDTEKFNK